MINIGDRVKYFVPGTIGVVGHGEVIKVGRKFLTVQGFYGTHKVRKGAELS